MINNYQQIATDLELLGKTLHQTIAANKRTIIESDMPKEQKDLLIEMVKDTEKSVAKGDMGMVIKVIEQLGNV